AFQSLVRPLLSKGEAELRIWRDAIQEALGPNALLIVDLVSELKLIIGEQPPVPVPRSNRRARRGPRPGRSLSQPRADSGGRRVRPHAWNPRREQLAKMCRHVRADPMFRHLQSVMDLRIVVEKLRHLGQHRFDLLVAGTCSSERHDAYSAAKLVADSVV